MDGKTGGGGDEGKVQGGRSPRRERGARSHGQRRARDLRKQSSRSAALTHLRFPLALLNLMRVELLTKPTEGAMTPLRSRRSQKTSRMLQNRAEWPCVLTVYQNMDRQLPAKPHLARCLRPVDNSSLLFAPASPQSETRMPDRYLSSTPDPVRSSTFGSKPSVVLRSPLALHGALILLHEPMITFTYTESPTPINVSPRFWRILCRRLNRLNRL